MVSLDDYLARSPLLSIHTCTLSISIQTVIRGEKNVLPSFFVFLFETILGAGSFQSLWKVGIFLFTKT